MQSERENGYGPTKYEPEVMAEMAGLVYVQDCEPGYTRKQWGRGFTYQDTDGATVRDKELRAYFESLVIPPAWRDVWICPHKDGHLLVTGRDDAGRKQYIYHPRWSAIRVRVKQDMLCAFGEALPALRERVASDLRKRSLTKAKVCALVVRLMEETLIRIGNDEYARNNDSYGLTTLLDDHVDFEQNQVIFEFRGKSGKEHEIALRDRRLARLVRACQELPGQRLFQYVDDDGKQHSLTSTDVNDYLHTVTGAAFTAKEFRTWGGTALAARLLHDCTAESEREQEQAVVDAVKQVAGALGNTPAVCRQHYIHPTILRVYHEGKLDHYYKEAVEETEFSDALSDHEVAVVLALRTEPLPDERVAK